MVFKLHENIYFNRNPFFIDKCSATKHTLNFRKRDIQTIQFNPPLPCTSTVNVHSKCPMNLLQKQNQTLGPLDEYNTKFFCTLQFLNTIVGPLALEKIVLLLNKKNSQVLQYWPLSLKKYELRFLQNFTSLHLHTFYDLENALENIVFHLFSLVFH